VEIQVDSSRHKSQLVLTIKLYVLRNGENKEAMVDEMGTLSENVEAGTQTEAVGQ
jgi:hypothetical protein